MDYSIDLSPPAPQPRVVQQASCAESSLTKHQLFNGLAAVGTLFGYGLIRYTLLDPLKIRTDATDPAELQVMPALHVLPFALGEILFGSTVLAGVGYFVSQALCPITEQEDLLQLAGGFELATPLYQSYCRASLASDLMSEPTQDCPVVTPPRSEARGASDYYML